jgi:hypothetical protein
LFYSAETYQVGIVLQPPQQHYVGQFSLPTPPAKAEVDARALAYIEKFPLNTHSATITLQAHPHGTLSTRTRYLDNMWSTLHQHTELQSRFTMRGRAEIRSLTLLWGSPKIIVPGIRFGGFKRKLNWLTVLGVRFSHDQSFRLVINHLLDPRQRYLPFIKWSLGLSKVQTRLQVV